ncbi:MAG: hypothetical protein Q8R85_21990 [Bosea sp. (in: a-proteobacteria)]|uniref:hypothetical protein n=1 Tax=Bosea sp. (in: a-proteobacteria) TaxID=1871050 RepID=UPI0027374823|nr:hypothetical protein [Bosea sp. (in: a-proteobacteria)]MDP3603835.1 hypothetical protein [Bosea sp. (in: a-proteobacteria)]WRH57156.1 MAG: hypothetical protein RSE11_19400 [Bosea sp. (in: a-proteobacteria)]
MMQRFDLILAATNAAFTGMSAATHAAAEALPQAQVPHRLLALVAHVHRWRQG